MFTVGFFTFLSVLYAGMYTMALVVVGLFWTDFLLKVVNARYSYIGKIGDYIMRHKDPERVGSIQKRFAWMIGLVLSSIVLCMLVIRFGMTG
jgi:Domain of unknown function (DUF4395)